ncbi:MAG: cyclodeaminase/cyclohydrolase family protein [Candidatus Izemoplasmatales bacterium]|jgi:formiminotetrahydrofolate cyclodeaminase|nr:cyclodeaminase/cyclohydrolase family protein [Candidatus Izemoplasmatales bacterium]MDD4988081.1 cyclodeaminase/cyclohydrolase family protein [Candidatus Izemoplasmatales bacterium]
MGLTDLSLTAFLDEIDSNSPAPGGGSASALAGALAASLAKMVGALTIGKKKYETLAEECKLEFVSALQMMGEIKEDLHRAIDRDTEAFNQVMDAYKLPKSTEEEKAFRHQQIQKATLLAIASPEMIATAAQKGLKTMEIILKVGNRNTLSDMGVAVLLFSSALEGAILNIKINLPGLDDRSLAEAYTLKNESMLKEMEINKKRLLAEIHQAILG